MHLWSESKTTQILCTEYYCVKYKWKYAITNITNIHLIETIESAYRETEREVRPDGNLQKERLRHPEGESEKPLKTSEQRECPPSSLSTSEEMILFRDWFRIYTNIGIYSEMNKKPYTMRLCFYDENQILAF